MICWWRWVATSALRETPRRVAAAFDELLSHEPVSLTTFPNEAGYDELVVVKAIRFHSLCMHHLLGLLLDAYAASGAGIHAIAQVDLDVRQNRHQPLEDLGPMTGAVLAAVTTRLRREGRLVGSHRGGVELTERPPLASLRALEDAA